jgi:cell wall-associated NlpC family hydrolase
MKIWLLGIFFQVAHSQSLVEKFIEEAHRLVEESEVSYVYGGSQYADGKTCHECNHCLAQRSPSSSMRLLTCPVCQQCSIDCSHFTQLVFRNVGIDVSYLTTQQMLTLPKDHLKKNFHWIDVSVQHAAPGDLLVYKGHVVILTSRMGPKGDIVHATGGKDIKLPGQGIQRERQIFWANFRGPLLRVLRHQKFAAAVHPKLIPVPKN